MRFRLPPELREFAAGAAVVDVPGSPATVREALDALWRVHPALRHRVLQETGELRPHVNVFVGVHSIRHARGLETAVDGDPEIAILRAVSGG